MSQNSHTPPFFFEDSIKSKLVERVYQSLAVDKKELAQRWASQFGVIDQDELGDAQWLNPKESADPTYFSLGFGTNTTGDLRLRALEALLAHGLKSAVHQVFCGPSGRDRAHALGRWPVGVASGMH